MRPASPAVRCIRHPANKLDHLLAAIHDAGVAVLAGTDFRPHSTIAAEVRQLPRWRPAAEDRTRASLS